MPEDDRPQPHSAVWFGDQRDFWWNADYLQLAARRLDLDRVRSVLDVGAGIGHWGRALATVLAPDARVVGVEPERRWIEEAGRRAEAAGVGDRFEYVEGTAEALPFADSSFDLVTCQTVLIHVADPRAALREMLRVTKPGGLVLAVEPNNRASVLVGTSVNADEPIEELIDRVRFVVTCERGKEALGEGNISVGDLVPGYLAEAGGVEIQAFVADKASLMVPPYEGVEQRLFRVDIVEQAGQSGFGWSRDEAERYYLAGGGSRHEFAQSWDRRTRETVAAADAVRRCEYHSAGATILYLVAARRPPG